MPKGQTKSNGRADKTFLSLYAGQVADPERWFRTAHELVAAATLLEPAVVAGWDALRRRARGDRSAKLRTSVHGVYFVLMGYAFENLAKGAIVAQDRGVRRETVATECMPARLKTHGLVGLAKRVGLSTNLDDESLLRRLTRHAVWAGRYPAPLTYDAAALVETFSDGAEYHVAFLGGNDVARARMLLVRLARHIHATVWSSTNLERWIRELETTAPPLSGENG